MEGIASAASVASVGFMGGVGRAVVRTAKRNTVNLMMCGKLFAMQGDVIFCRKKTRFLQDGRELIEKKSIGFIY